MPRLLRRIDGHFHRFGRRRRVFAATLSLMLLAAFPGFGQSGAKKSSKPVTPKEPEFHEVLILKNGDRLTGQLLNSTGKEISFQTNLAGKVTVVWADVKELKSDRGFAIIPKNIKDATNSALVPEGPIELDDKVVVIHTAPVAKLEASPAKVSPLKTAAAKTMPVSDIAFVVDDKTYRKQIHQRIGFISGWDGHIDTGSTLILSTQSSYTFQAGAALKRTVPTVSWLNPELRTTANFNLSAGESTQANTPRVVTNIFHGDAERDKYFTPRGYFLQMVSFDHNFSQGLLLQQNYGAGLGATLFKQEDSEFDITADLHYESQQFNATADVSEKTLDLVGSSLTEAYTQSWGEIDFDEKVLADMAFNNMSAFSASGTASVRMPVYKNLGFAVSVIDNLLNNPQVGFKKNSLQFSTGFSLNLH